MNVHLFLFFISFLSDNFVRSAILCIDVTNHQIGLSLGYYRQQAPATDETDSYAENNKSEGVSNSATTLITPLPPIPYMSNKTYHPSYAFLHRPELDKQQASTSLRRKERTLEIANQLAHLATQREINGILIRWPGDLGGVVCGSTTSNEEISKNREEDQLLLSLEDCGSSSSNNIAQAETVHEHGDGSMGYLRGRILYLLDSCCSSHGHNETKVSSEPFLKEGVRPFALWDTSNSEQEWVLSQQQHKSTLTNTNRVDKYGNSFTETDAWGRSAIFGNHPPKPTQGQFRYSSKQLHLGFRVSCEFGSSKAASVKPPSHTTHQDNFDSFQDSESYMKQFEGSLAAMHALYEFVGVHLNGRITLPSWVSTSPETKTCKQHPVMGEQELLSEDPSTVHNGYRRSTNTAGRSTNNSKQESAPPRKGKLVALAKMPARRRRREVDRSS